MARTLGFPPSSDPTNSHVLGVIESIRECVGGGGGRKVGGS
jgi:hypothetical protein